MKVKSKRSNPNYRLKVRLVQESNNHCAFCNFSDAGRLEFHHIDENPSNTIQENLIAVCPNCHSLIGEGKISQEEVIMQKQKLQKEKQIKERKSTSKIEIKESTFNNPIFGDNNTVNINIKKQVTKKIVEKYPEGSIGRDVIMCGYAKYLADRYFEYKNYELKLKGLEFKYSILYGNVKKEFKSAGFFHVPQSRFFELVEYLQSKIDRTLLAKINKGKGNKKNYSTFEEYQLENKILPN